MKGILHISTSRKTFRGMRNPESGTGCRVKKRFRVETQFFDSLNLQMSRKLRLIWSKRNFMNLRRSLIRNSKSSFSSSIRRRQGSRGMERYIMNKVCLKMSLKRRKRLKT